MHFTFISYFDNNEDMEQCLLLHVFLLVFAVPLWRDKKIIYFILKVDQLCVGEQRSVSCVLCIVLSSVRT